MGIREVLRKIMLRNPRASEADHRDAAWQSIQKSSTLQYELFLYWFENTYRLFAVDEVKPHSFTVVSRREQARELVKSSPERVDKRAATVLKRAETRAIVERTKENMRTALMDHILSNGKALRTATFGDCAVEGGWLTAVSKQGKANEIVGKKLTEANLRSLMARHAKRAA